MKQTSKTMAQKTTIRINFVKLFFNIFVIAIIFLAIFAIIPLVNAIVIAFVLAYILNPIISFVENRHLPRLVGVISIFVLLIISIWFIVVLIKNYFPSIETISDISDRVIDSLNHFKNLLKEKYDIIKWDDIFDSLQGNVSASRSLTSRIPGLLSGIAGMSSQLTIIFFSLFFFLLSGRAMRKALFTFIPNKYFEITVVTINEVDKIFGGYIRGTLLECLVIGILTTVGFVIVGFPMSIAITTGTIAGLSNAIPYIGPLIGGVIGVAVCLLDLIPANFTPMFGITASIPGVLAIVGIVQFFDNIIVKPTILGQSVNLHPMLVAIGIMVGSQMMGFIGMIIAIPIIAIIKVMIETLYRQLKGFNLLSDNLVSIHSKKVID